MVPPLNPWFVTGFSDGEATFSVTIRENPSKNGIGWQILFTFQIVMKNSFFE